MQRRKSSRVSDTGSSRITASKRPRTARERITFPVVVNSYACDPYGNAISSTGTVANPFRYIGAVWDSGTGLYKMGER